MPEPQWPNLFVVGAPKAGTTSLWRYLGEHPDIYMSPVKEPSFFSKRRTHPTPEEAAPYLELFAAARGEKLRGEASPGYMTRKTVPATIRRLSPDAKIVISLREPIERTHSSYMSLVSDGVETRSFLEVVRDDLAGLRLPDRPIYVKPNLYAEGVLRYQEAFGDQLHVLFFESLAANPAKTMRRLYEFLGVDPAFAERFDPKPHNQLRQPRNRAIERLLAARRLGRRLVPAPLREPVAQAVTKPAVKPRPDEESVALLRDAYGPDVQAVREMVGGLPKAWERHFPPPVAVQAPGTGEPAP